MFESEWVSIPLNKGYPLMNSPSFLTLKPHPRVQEPGLYGIDEEAAKFMNLQPKSKKKDVWKILNSSMSCREKLDFLHYDFNPGEKRAAKKWILRNFPEKPLTALEPLFLRYLKNDDSVLATSLVEKQDFKELDRIVESYSPGQIQLYEAWKANALKKNPQIEYGGTLLKPTMPAIPIEVPSSKQVWLLNYTTAYIMYITAEIFLLSLRLKEVFENGRVHHQTGDLFRKTVLYVPSIVFAFYYPLFGKHKSECPSIASPWLRLLITVVAGLFVFYEVFYIILCGTQFYGWTCSSGILFERILELLFFIGLAVFMTHNNCYPRENKLFFAHLCSAAVYAYVNILIEEQVKIYEVILKDQNFTLECSTLTSSRSYSTNTRGYRMAEPVQVLPPAVSTLLEDSFEMCHVAISEFLIVAISITSAILNDLGNEKKPQKKSCDSLWERSFPFKQAAFWSTFLVIVMISLDSSASIGRTLLFGIHILVLVAGMIICLNSLKPPGKEEESTLQILHEESPSDILDRYLLNFGAVGMLCSITAGTIHSYGIRESLPFATFVIYSASIVQVISQTLIIQSGARIRNIKGWNGKALWLVNFALFCLDLYNAATLGVYSMPIPKNTNLFWAWLVRGLGSFEVFYRFHSLAVIAENIEFHEKMDMEKKWSGRYSARQKDC